MSKDLIQQGNSLISYYVNKYNDLYNATPMINRNTAKWAARDIIESFGYNDCAEAIDWYFKVKERGHDWNWYTNNVEKLISARRDKERDDMERKVVRMRAREWLNG